MTTEPAAESATVQPEDEVVDLCRDLLRIDTTNPGDGTGPGEIEAAAYVVGSQKHSGHMPAFTKNATPSMAAPASSSPRSPAAKAP
ncbi:MAG TPA: hypothetical protein PLA46_06080, partial [Phycicoccus sp.]|nr:hypothetical protein [Phycicoccus sp.]